MTEEQLQAIEQACAQATRGPWKAVRPGHRHANGKYLCVQIDKKECYTTLEMLSDDARFIASARTWVPELVAEVRRLHVGYQVELATLRREYDGVCRSLAAREQELDMLQKAQAAERQREQEE